MSPIEVLSSPWASTLLAGLGVAVAVRAFLGFRSARQDENAARGALEEVQRAESSLAKRPTEDSGEASAGIDSLSDIIAIRTLWALNQKRIDSYHRIATSQSKQSFISSQVATGLGFFLIIFVGFIATTATTTVGAISAGAVGLVGGGLSAYISSTFMKGQADANSQLRQFFFQPVEFARLLAVERLIDTLDQASRAQAVHNIVNAMTANTISGLVTPKEEPKM